MDPKKTRIIAIIVVVLVVVAGLGIYFYRANNKVNASASNCTLTSSNPILVDQAETPDSIDPAVTFTTPGWAIVQQIYQGMVNYNQSSYTTFLPVLAQNWSTSADGFHWNFTLRNGVVFSNGDPYNAYVEWFSLYRDLAVAAGSQFILAENFWFPGVVYPTFNTTIVTDLNTFNFANPTASQIAVMEASGQSFQVLNANTIELNLGLGYLGAIPYRFLLASLSAPNSYAVDPSAIQQNGGVAVGSKNSWMAGNMLGTGPYELVGSYSASGTGYTLQPNPRYWGAAAAAAAPWNNMIQPAHSSVQVIYQDSSQVTVQDLISGSVATASFAYIGPSTITQLTGQPCVTIQPLPAVFGSTSGSWWIYMNQSQPPFNNFSVRQAVVHAINYQQIISEAFGGYAQQWVGPVPPSYPYYNPGNLTPYQYNLPLAKAEMANSPYPSGYGPTLNYEYLNLGDWYGVSVILADNLAQIGIKLNLVPITLPQLFTLQAYDSTTGRCTAQEVSNGLGPFPIGQEFYTSDYVSPDDWTQNDAVNTGSANMCMSGYNNATVNALVYSAAGESNPATLMNDYSMMTQLMYQNYTDAWLVVPTSFAVYNPLLHGFYENPMASAEPFSLLFNTQSTS